MDHNDETHGSILSYSHYIAKIVMIAITFSEPTVMDVARVNVMHMNGTEVLIIMVSNSNTSSVCALLHGGLKSNHLDL